VTLNPGFFRDCYATSADSRGLAERWSVAQAGGVS
jgi:hypothetical protein